MKRYILLLLVMLAAAISCNRFDDSAIWDELNDHKERIEKLEEACNRLNANISAMQKILEALSQNDYVTDVVKIMEDGVEVGYSLTFAKGGTVTIYNGSDGADGESGSTPKIGVQKAADGEYYWTADGEWLTDEDGARIPAVVADDGDGQYITPKFRIADDVWYISFDGGNTWREFTKMNAEEDVCLFESIDFSDPEYIVLVLKDGTSLTIHRSSTMVKSYFKDEIEVTRASIKELMTEPCLIFPMLSDIHYGISSEKPYLIDDCTNNILELSKHFNFDFIACLGDIVQGNKPQEVTEEQIEYVIAQFNKIDAPLYVAIGNHDENRDYKPVFTHTQLYQNYLSHIKNVFFDNSPVMCNTNYYKDFDDLKLRCIFLNANTNGSYGYSSDTCDWFDSVVEESPYRFIVFTHISPIPSQNLGASYGTDSGSTRIRNTCAESDKFIIMFSGHNHYDHFMVEPFMSFTMNCQKFENSNPNPSTWPEGAVKQKRTVGTATEDCFDIVVIRPGSKKINLVRFGAGEDQEFDFDMTPEDLLPPVEDDGASVLDITSQFIWTPGTCTAATGGVSSSDTYWLYSNLVNVSDFHHLTFTHCQTTTTNTSLGYAFYDSSKTYISGVTNAGTSYRPLERIIAVPENAVYFRGMWMNTTHASYDPVVNNLSNFYCHGVRDINVDESILYGSSIACIGDSITAGVGADGLPYPTQLADRLNATVKNLGASGTVLCTGGHRTCNIGKLTLANCKDKDIVTILLGINDWDQARNNETESYYSLGDINSTETSCIYGAVKMWCEKIVELKSTAECADTRFYFMTPVVTKWNSSTGLKSWSQDKTNIHGFVLRDLCNAIIDVCALYDIPVIDLNMYSGIYYNNSTDQNVELYGGDGVHINQAGHTLVTEAIIKALAEHAASIGASGSGNGGSDDSEGSGSAGGGSGSGVEDEDGNIWYVSSLAQLEKAGTDIASYCVKLQASASYAWAFQDKLNDKLTGKTVNALRMRPSSPGTFHLGVYDPSTKSVTDSRSFVVSSSDVNTTKTYTFDDLSVPSGSYFVWNNCTDTSAEAMGYYILKANLDPLVVETSGWYRTSQSGLAEFGTYELVFCTDIGYTKH